MMSEEERKILHKDSAKFTYDANPYLELSEQEWVLVQRAEQSIIDILEDYHHKKVAWLCLQGPEVAIHGFVEAIRARVVGKTGSACRATSARIGRSDYSGAR